MQRIKRRFRGLFRKAEVEGELDAELRVRAWVFGITAVDDLTYLCTALLLVAVAVLAGWMPARRAVRVDPAVALRCG